MHLNYSLFPFVYTTGVCYTVQRAPQGAALLARLLRQPTGAVEVPVYDQGMSFCVCICSHIHVYTSIEYMYIYMYICGYHVL